jgi:predicted Zn-dependent protease
MFEHYFDHLVLLLQSQRPLLSGNILFVQWRAERSDFVRFNHGQLRQAGTVERHGADLRVIQGQRVALLQLALTGNTDDDAALIKDALRELLARIADAPEDPHLLVNTAASESLDSESSTLVEPHVLVEAVQQEAEGHDLVGAYMGGPMACGLWSSLGAKHYFERCQWSLDYSLYARSDATHQRRDKAVKATLSGDVFSRETVRASIQDSLLKLEVLYRTPKVLAPGSYRALLAPAALAELVEMMCWGGFSARSQLTGQSPLAKLRAGEVQLSGLMNLGEDLRQIPAPRFQADGFVRPIATELIRSGRAVDWFCSPRTGREFGIEPNGASNDEGPAALSMHGGSLLAADELSALGTGLAISNLWYLNFSDRSNARVTGMTRFASFWVEDGQWVAPIVPMRFDDSLFNLLGSELQALGVEPARLPNLSSYDWRSSSATLAPSALINAMRFTL